MKGNRGWKKLGQTAGTFALGATAGSLLALLYAPTSGRMVRRRIVMKLRSLQNSTLRQIKQTQRLLVKKAGTLRQVAFKKIGHTRDWFVEKTANGNGRKALYHRRARVVHHA